MKIITDFLYYVVSLLWNIWSDLVEIPYFIPSPSVDVVMKTRKVNVLKL